jgi:hypothetical protein
MTRRFFIFQYLLALLLCLGACAMRIRSFSTGESFCRMNDGLCELGFKSERGTLLICRQCCRWGTSYPPKWSYVSFPPDGAENFRKRSQSFEFVGFAFWLETAGGYRTRCVILPWLAIILAFLSIAVLAFPLVNTRITWRRRRPGLCPACGYDLRSSLVQCPECGRTNDTPKERLGRRSIWMAGTSTCLFLASTFVLCWWSNPSRGALGGPVGSLAYNPPWENARGAAPERMLRSDPDWGQSWHQAIWHRTDQSQEDLLVIVGNNIGSMYDATGEVKIYLVTALDRSMHVVRQGTVGLPPHGSTPYRLVEIRSNDPSLPTGDRGKWVLAVDSLPSAKFRKTSPGGEQTEFHRSVVAWDDLGGLSDVWMHARDLKVRPAEPAPN